MTGPLTPTQSVRRGLNIDDALPHFAFTPSVGIHAGRINKLGVDIRSFREPLKRSIQRVMAPSFGLNFSSGGRPDPWEPLADATVLIRGRSGYDDKPLVRTGLLAKTAQQLNIWTIGKVAASIQDLPDKIWYGKVHQAGTEGTGSGRSMKGYLKRAGGDAKEAQLLLDDDLIHAMRTGTKLGGKSVKGIPARPFVVIQEEDFDAIEKIFVEWLTERAAAAGVL